MDDDMRLRHEDDDLEEGVLPAGADDAEALYQAALAECKVEAAATADAELDDEERGWVVDADAEVAAEEAADADDQDELFVDPRTTSI